MSRGSDRSRSAERAAMDGGIGSVGPLIANVRGVRQGTLTKRALGARSMRLSAAGMNRGKGAQDALFMGSSTREKE
jgi:hypothetical protein